MLCLGACEMGRLIKALEISSISTEIFTAPCGYTMFSDTDPWREERTSTRTCTPKQFNSIHFSGYNYNM